VAGCGNRLILRCLAFRSAAGSLPFSTQGTMRHQPGLLVGPVLLAGGLLLPAAWAQSGYQKPPAAVLEVLSSPAPPLTSISPTRDRILLIDRVRYPPIADLAQPMLRLAGERINPRTNGPHAPPRYTALRVKGIADGRELPVTVPEKAYLGTPAWSLDGKRLAFSHTREDGIELWVADAATGKASAVRKLRLNQAAGSGYQWMPDSRTLLVHSVPPGRGQAPEAPRAPDGPVIQESAGERAPVRTFPDLLRNPHDEALFDYYFTSQLAYVEAPTGRVTPVGKPGLYDAVDPSPDGKHLLVSRMERPYSYLIGAWGFPRRVEIWDRSGKLEHAVAQVPLAEKVPIGGVITGPRGHEWVPTEAATLVWAEALDGGDPKKKVPQRDVVRILRAPFRGTPAELVRTEHRFTGLDWMESGGEALLREFDRDRLWSRTWLIRSDALGGERRLVWDRSVNDRYGNPGTPVVRRLPNGHSAVWRNGDTIYLAGAGASREGDRPFLDRFDLKDLKAVRLFQSEAGAYETAVALVSDDGPRFITQRETPSEPPNLYLRTAGRPERTALTSFPDPTPQIRGIRKQLVTYKRADGVPLSFTLYLPPGYQEGQRLPTVVWAYPQEFNDASTAGQVSGSPNRFTSILGTSHLFFVLNGYAVLDDATMPVVGPPETVNDSFIEQVVASAKAAIDKAAEMGVTDPERVGVGGHSYGAFMTANLLAHSDLFRAGIARSGAYNRTLTPFGFQSERRTLWEAPEVYARLSPFTYVHRINEPLLLIHGEADNNPGTFPIQSERLYHAVKGTGGTVRFVSLPFESHGYRARESVEHTLFEMLRWFDRHVKNDSSAAGR
jgi:dipeptidyl aminopeptidase/acylaminoacyl peptidase